MLNYFCLLLVLCTGLFGFSQATLFTEDFESAGASWNATDDVLPNFWIINTCSGNGPTTTGSNAMYISPGGTVAGCGPTGMTQHAYVNSPSGTLRASYHTTVDATCATALQVSFDYRIEGNAAEDIGELIYSTDGGTNWTVVGSALPASATWTTTTIALPATLDASSFELGFRFTYNDANVNGAPFAVDNITVSGTDTTPPTLICPATITQGVTTNCQGIADDYTKAVLNYNDNCTDSVDIVLTQNIAELTVFSAGPGQSEIILVTATDEAGNSTQCSMTINLVDDMSPTLTCPSDTNLFVDNNCEVILGDFTGLLVVTDNCTTAGNFTLTQSPTSGTTLSGAPTDNTITLTATDEAGITESCTFIARTIDTLVANITCPADTVIHANSGCQTSLPDYTSLAIASDNCVASASLTITQAPPPGTMVNADQTITMTVTGGTPNIPQSCTFNGVFIDTVSPSILCPLPSTLYVNSTCDATLTDYTNAVVVGDNCTSVPTVTQTPIPGTSLTSATNISVTLTATDASGNSSSCQFTQPVIDTISPIISCPGNQPETVDASCFATIGDYTSLATTSDNCTSVFSVSQAPVSGTAFSDTTVVTLSITDDAGNSSSCTFEAIPHDVTAPSIICPPATTASADASCMYTLTDLTGPATSADNCTPAIDLVFSQSPAPGTVLATGNHTISVTVADASGNSNSCAFSLDVVDNTAPDVTCPSNQNVISDVNCTGTLGDYTGLITTTDNCSTTGNITISQSPASGTTISSDTPITITVTDELSNSNSCVFNALLIDTIAPEVTCPTPQTLAINSSCQYTVPDLSGTLTGSDNCSLLSNMTINQNPPAGSLQGGTTSVLVTLTDEQGNSSFCIAELLPDDITPPTITCPSPGAVNNGTSCSYTLPNYGTMASVIDNCSNYTIVQSPLPGTNVTTGVNTITLTVTDAGGNTEQCSFPLTVIETEAPVISCPSDISTCDPVVTYTSPIFSDNCAVSLSQTDLSGLSSGMTFPVGITTLSYAAIDSSGNTQSCSFNIEILEYPSPATISEDTLWLCDENTTLLSAEPIISGSGLWSLVSGQGNFNNQFANSTGVNNLGTGTSVFAWTVSSSSCGSLSDTVVVVNSQEDLPASTQDTILACSEPIVLLQANEPLYGTGIWSTTGNANIANVNSANTSATISTSGWQSFIWTITSGGCPPSSDTVHVLSNLAPTILTSDTSMCIENGDFTAIGSTPTPEQTVSWSAVSGSVMVSPQNSASTNVSNLALGTNIVAYTIEHIGCPAVHDTLNIVGILCDGFNPVLPTVITPNLDGRNDLFVIDHLEEIHPECHVTIFNRWGSVVYESTGYKDPWDGTHKGKPLPMGTYFYRIELNDEAQTILKGDISIIH